MTSDWMAEDEIPSTKPNRPYKLWAMAMLVIGLLLGVLIMTIVQPSNPDLHTPSTALIEECRKRFSTTEQQEACITGLDLTKEKDTSNDSPVDEDKSSTTITGTGNDATVDKQRDFNIVALGAAQTEGIGIKDRTKAYPNLLSPSAVNLAHGSMGPNMHAICFDTSFEDMEIPDIIVLEDWLHYEEGLALLASRIRQRFPNALILFIEDAPPFFYRKNADNAKGFVNFAQWYEANQDELKVANNNNDDDDDAAAIAQIKAKLTAEADSIGGDWFIPPHPNADDAIEDIMTSVGAVHTENITDNVGGVLWKMLPPLDTGYETLAANVEYYWQERSFSFRNLNEAGHAKVANELLDIIDVARATKGVPIDNGPLGSDSCHIWHYTGDGIPEDRDNMMLVEYRPNTHYYVLELDGSYGWMNVTNPLAEAVPLYLSYLTDDEEGYLPPEAVVEIQDSNGVSLGSTILNTLFEPAPTHGVIRTVAVSQPIPPGQEIKVMFTVTNTTATEDNFRLSGYLFSVTAPNEWYFAPYDKPNHR
mmetsp:Transcript_24799/g.37692  ORF Transcript_24799/g.37692 Transcript_24799/m.37692 type:complete len:533 (-) Transcript_24799:295-1893(-)|eukprot:CAMPEP_0178905962 /NCGR_PEP_ID=MMETSP0786-20121207/6566_1 /TAXON_ID=186022 /ORGANISM="Thalassionema frauenfeldii, Strain CCMP 1798" /LENGTH=532 /DNA_ID=CAMNT_0020577627 /DNA_START=41 /DNA_END=1642 /DNA_ORIENTATION=-